MFEDKTLVCKDCGAELSLQQVSKSSMLKKDLKTSQRDAKHVEMQRRMLQRHQESSLQPYVQSVEKKQRFLSNLTMRSLFIVASAMQRNKVKNN